MGASLVTNEDYQGEYEARKLADKQGGQRDMTTADRNDIIWLMASMGCPPCLQTLEQLDLSLVGEIQVIHTVETDIVKLVVEIKSFGMSSDEFDKETGSSDGLQPKQADLSCVHALNELHLHEIRVVPINVVLDEKLIRSQVSLAISLIANEKIANTVKPLDCGFGKAYKIDNPIMLAKLLIQLKLIVANPVKTESCESG
ncbi:hypothetical protein Tco_0583620 [Tanacetum coccineum]